MPSSPSFQLPDLLNLSRQLVLRTNRHCHAVSTASEQWFTGDSDDRVRHEILTADERRALRSMKIGLLAAACFPTCDAPQLRLVTDFLTALVCCTARLGAGRTLRDCGWIEELPDGRGDALGCLAENELFWQLMPKIASSMRSESWRTRFSESAKAFREAQMQVIANRQNDIIPDLEAYLNLGRNLSGIPMIFDLIELAEGLEIPSSRADSETWTNLKCSAADVIAVSMDIFAYNNDQYTGNSHNIVSIIQAEKHLSIQGATNAAFAIVSQSFQRFLAAEVSLFPAPETHLHPQAGPAWSWNPLSRKRSSPELSGHGQGTMDADAKLYMRGLKDCIVGTLNWSYETELYFGVKGDEVRQFGWVFLRVPGD
ncbi:isoprenoid synthase domain-containing protein [Mycena sp. CBHHK59/15]|nr:isoprenoid synthase domain-containing protein [Mycena sp. CBHHK59/15]